MSREFPTFHAQEKYEVRLAINTSCEPLEKKQALADHRFRVDGVYLGYGNGLAGVWDT